MPGGRPSKPIALVKGHRTKAEKSIRQNAEAELLTGVYMKENPEVRSNPMAHKEFVRLRRLLKSIHKDDDLSGNVINTHCMLHAECKEFEELKASLYKDVQEVEANKSGMEFMSYLDQKDKLMTKLMTCDKKIMEKRKMMLDLAKENIMTIQSALRSIPKKPIEQQKSKMAELIERRQAK